MSSSDKSAHRVSIAPHISVCSEKPALIQFPAMLKRRPENVLSALSRLTVVRVLAGGFEHAGSTVVKGIAE